VRIEKWKWLSNCILWLSLQENQHRDSTVNYWTGAIYFVLLVFSLVMLSHQTSIASTFPSILRYDFLMERTTFTVLNCLSKCFQESSRVSFLLFLHINLFLSIRTSFATKLNNHLPVFLLNPTTPPSFTSPYFHQKLQNYGSS